MEKTKLKFRRRLNEEGVAGYIFILPFVVGFLGFTLIPLLSLFGLSFTDYDILSAPRFVGLQNYKELFGGDPLFWKSLSITFYYTFLSVPLRLVAALLIAMALVKTSRASNLYRAVYYLPSIMGSSVAVAVTWKRLFDKQGAVNSILQSIGINSQTVWLGQTDTAIWVLIILSVWQFGSSMLIFLSGLKQIPVSLYEAATVDGAGKVRQFFKITLPMLTPVIFFNLIMELINGFMSFTQCYIITEGKPLNSTLFYTVYMYQNSFQYYKLGYGCAMAWIMLIILAVFTAVLFRTSDKWVYYQNS